MFPQLYKWIRHKISPLINKLLKKNFVSNIIVFFSHFLGIFLLIIWIVNLTSFFQLPNECYTVYLSIKDDVFAKSYSKYALVLTMPYIMNLFWSLEGLILGWFYNINYVFPHFLWITGGVCFLIIFKTANLPLFLLSFYVAFFYKKFFTNF